MGVKRLMNEKVKTISEGADSINGDRWPELESRFRLVIVATLRSKQLLRGARPRIEANTLRRRNTSIALEEVKQGLVPFTTTGEER